MQKLTAIGIAVSLSVALAACSPSIGGGADGHSIDFDGRAIALHAPARPAARINSTGDLAINGNAIATTPAQRALLQRLYREAHALLGTGANQMRAGLDLGGQAATAKAASILHAHDARSAQRESALSATLALDSDLQCRDAAAIADAERELAATLPAFAPYARARAPVCRDHRPSPTQ